MSKRVTKIRTAYLWRSVDLEDSYETAAHTEGQTEKIMDILAAYIIGIFADVGIEQGDKDKLFDGLACKYYLSKRKTE